MVTTDFRHIGLVVSEIEEIKNIFTNFLGLTNFKDVNEINKKYISELVKCDVRNIKICVFTLPDNSKIELLDYGEKGNAKEIFSYKVGVNHFALTMKNLDVLYYKRDQFDIEFVNAPMLNPEKTVKLAYVKIKNQFFVELVQILEHKP